MADYSEELVELIKRTIREACPSDGECLADEDECFRAHPIHDGATRDGVIESVYADVDGAARLIADALSSSGRLVPEGSEVREEWRLRFDYADGTDGRLTTADGDEARAWARAHLDCKHGTEMVGRRVITTPWTPSEPTQETPDA